jgi:hypothetical protein
MKILYTLIKNIFFLRSLKLTKIILAFLGGSGQNIEVEIKDEKLSG